MTISTSTGRIQYSGNGSTDIFATNFKLLDTGHAKVILTSAAGVDTVQTITTHYTVGVITGTTANITMVTPPASGETLTLKLNAPLTQNTDLINGQSVNADVVETALDLGTQVDQRISEDLVRSLKAPETVATAFDGVLPSITATYLLRVNAAGDGFDATDALTAFTDAGGLSINDLIYDTSPQLGGDLDVNGQDITGIVQLNGLTHPAADGTANQVMKTDGSGNIDFTSAISVTTLDSSGAGTFGGTVVDADSITFSDSNIADASGNIEYTSLSVNRDHKFYGGATLGATIDMGANGAYIYANSVTDHTGSGTPEAAVTAAIGSTYRRSDGGAGTSLYIKESGAGNTGWVAYSSPSASIANVVEDTTPQLGGDLDVNGNDITGTVQLNGITYPGSDGTANQHLKTDGAGNLAFVTPTAYLANVVEDTTPQLGGTLDVNGQDITGTVQLNGLTYPGSDGSANQHLKTDGAGNLAFATPTVYMADVSDDATPTLGGNLDAGSNDITAVDALEVANAQISSTQPTIDFIDGATTTEMYMNSGYHYYKTSSAGRDHIFGHNTTGSFTEKARLDMTDGSLNIQTLQVVGIQQSAIADASGGATIDAEARTALNALLAALRTHGLIAT